MFIHEVQSGESLFGISSKYGTTVDQLRMVNGLVETNLVPGQALLIPLYTYIVQPGDTFFTIARRAYVTVEQLKNANPSINASALQAGTRIQIPNTSNYLASTLSFYVVRSPALDQTLITNFAPYASIISLFEYHFAVNGSIANELNDATAVQTTWQSRVTPIVTITNLTEQGFSPELVHQVLNNPAARTTLINNIVSLISRKGYGGVNIDFEQVLEEDRDLFTGFLRQLAERLKPAGLIMTVAVPAKTSENIPWLRGYDYGGIGAVVDYMFIMAYDWHHAGSEPGAGAPITEVRKTIEFATSRLPRSKIILGMPLYGYDWVIPYSPGTVAQATSNQNAIATAMRYQSPIQYSKEAESPFFQYRDNQGVTHQVWFEDVRSISAKMILVRQYGLQGLGAWQLTLGFPQGPWLLRKFFKVRKR
jgi:spore germination protein